MRGRITERLLHGHAATAWWLAVSLVLVQGIAPSLPATGPQDVSARLASLHNGPLQPAEVAHDPVDEPRPVARPAYDAGADVDSATMAARSRAEAWQLASTWLAAAPRPAGSREGAAWRVGFGWRAPPVGT